MSAFYLIWLKNQIIFTFETFICIKHNLTVFHIRNTFLLSFLKNKLKTFYASNTML